MKYLVAMITLLFSLQGFAEQGSLEIRLASINCEHALGGSYSEETGSCGVRLGELNKNYNELLKTKITENYNVCEELGGEIVSEVCIFDDASALLFKLESLHRANYDEGLYD